MHIDPDTQWFGLTIFFTCKDEIPRSIRDHWRYRDEVLVSYRWGLYLLSLELAHPLDHIGEEGATLVYITFHSPARLVP